MLARLEYPLLHLFNPISSQKTTLDVGQFDQIEHYFLGPSNKRIAISGEVSGSSRLYVADLNHKQAALIYEGNFYDFNWLDEDQVILNSGTHLIKVNVHDGSAETLARISRVSMGPMRLSANPSSTRIAGVNPYDKPFVYTGGEKEIQKVSFRIWDYCWFNEDEILYSYQNGLKLYNCSTGEKANFLINFSQLKKIPGLKEFCKEYSLQDCNDLYLKAPQLIRGKIYFQMEAFFSGSGTVSALLSVEPDKSVGEVLFVSQDALFKDFEVSPDGEMFSILGIRNLEGSETECKTILHGEELELNGYYPVRHIRSMSALSLYQDYYEPDNQD